MHIEHSFRIYIHTQRVYNPPMEAIQNKRRGLMVPGLQSVRNTLGFSISELANRTQLHPNHLWKVESGKSGLGGQAFGDLVGALYCTPNDLIIQPSIVRLAQIKLGYLMRQVEQQKAHVLELEIKQQEDLLL